MRTFKTDYNTGMNVRWYSASGHINLEDSINPLYFSGNYQVKPNQNPKLLGIKFLEKLGTDACVGKKVVIDEIVEIQHI
ncbi:MAG: hypothetical protein AABW88_00825 [Nanoarchaeota archaeon]